MSSSYLKGLGVRTQELLNWGRPPDPQTKISSTALQLQLFSPTISPLLFLLFFVADNRRLPLLLFLLFFVADIALARLH